MVGGHIVRLSPPGLAYILARALVQSGRLRISPTSPLGTVPVNPDHRAQIFLVTRSGGQTHSFRQHLPRANLGIYVFILSNTVVSKYVMEAKWKEKVEGWKVKR